MPSLTAAIWRYLSFAKLSDFLDHPSRLYLARLDQQEDDAEGRWPANAERLMFTGGGDPETLREALAAERRRTYSSCWTLRREACDRMWNEYAAGDGAAVVVTTISRRSRLTGH